jgi:hypothetical protein
MMKKSILLVLGLLLTPLACAANDGFGGLSATGLQFQQSASVRMVSEDLFLSPSQVRVTYREHPMLMEFIRRAGKMLLFNKFSYL